MGTQPVSYTHLDVYKRQRYNSSAITSDGKVYAWGRNDEGQIGNVNVALRTNEPMNVMAGATNSEDEESSLENIVAIAIGANHMTALRLDGKVYSWGADMFGQLGDGRNGYCLLYTSFYPFFLSYPCMSSIHMNLFQEYLSIL